MTEPSELRDALMRAEADRDRALNVLAQVAAVLTGLLADVERERKDLDDDVA